MPQETKEIEILTDYIRLDAFLKFTASVGTGGEAKLLIQDGKVSVNGEICTQRTHKLRDSDLVKLGGESFVIRGPAK